VILDRCQVVVEIGPNKPFLRPWFNLIYLILYKDPDSRFEYEYDPEGYVQDRESSQDRQLRRVAELTRRYCDEMLKGDFSRQGDLKRFIRRCQASDPLNAGQ
jgi:YD repeat-containing protein